MRLIGIAIFFSIAMLPPWAFATEKCDPNDQTQTGMNICAKADFDAADAKLNQLYKQLAGKAEGDEKKALRDAQRAWVAYRDAECIYETAGPEGGSIRPMEEWQCATALTTARIGDFAKFIAGQ